jgi:hypothetical protein
VTALTTTVTAQPTKITQVVAEAALLLVNKADAHRDKCNAPAVICDVHKLSLQCLKFVTVKTITATVKPMTESLNWVAEWVLAHEQFQVAPMVSRESVHQELLRIQSHAITSTITVTVKLTKEQLQHFAHQQQTFQQHNVTFLARLSRVLLARTTSTLAIQTDVSVQTMVHRNCVRLQVTVDRMQLAQMHCCQQLEPERFQMQHYRVTSTRLASQSTQHLWTTNVEQLV